MKKSYRILLFLLGLALLCIVAITVMVGVPNTNKNSRSLLTFEGISQHARGGFDWSGRYEIERKIELSYSESMRINQSQALELNYAETYKKITGDMHERDIAITLGPALRAPLTAIVDAPAFDISPTENNTVQAGVLMPVSLNWILTPKKKGDHIILLRIPEILESETIRINRNTNENLNSGAIKIPINVYTLWGIQEITLKLIQGFFALLGFLLMYPTLHDWIKSKYIDSK